MKNQKNTTPKNTENNSETPEEFKSEILRDLERLNARDENTRKIKRELQKELRDYKEGRQDAIKEAYAEKLKTPEEQDRVRRLLKEYKKSQDAVAEAEVFYPTENSEFPPEEVFLAYDEVLLLVTGDLYKQGNPLRVMLSEQIQSTLDLQEKRKKEDKFYTPTKIGMLNYMLYPDYKKTAIPVSDTKENIQKIVQELQYSDYEIVPSDFEQSPIVALNRALEFNSFSEESSDKLLRLYIKETPFHIFKKELYKNPDKMMFMLDKCYKMAKEKGIRVELIMPNGLKDHYPFSDFTPDYYKKIIDKSAKTVKLSLAAFISFYALKEISIMLPTYIENEEDTEINELFFEEFDMPFLKRYQYDMNPENYEKDPKKKEAIFKKMKKIIKDNIKKSRENELVDKKQSYKVYEGYIRNTKNKENKALEEFIEKEWEKLEEK